MAESNPTTQRRRPTTDGKQKPAARIDREGRLPAVALTDELNQLKANLLSAVSHELRTPLAAIKGYSTMLLDYDDRLERQEKREYLESIDKATDRLAQLLENLLDTARLEAGMVKLHPAPCRVPTLLDAVAQGYCFEGTQNEVTVHVDGRLPVLFIDEKRIRQVISHLIDNAIKYSGPGQSVSVEAVMNGKSVLISVADRGPGIPQGESEAIFDRMHRVEQRLASHPIGGLGLGLSLCKALVELHNGRIWAENRDGGGSIFLVSLPAGRTRRSAPRVQTKR